MGPGYTLFMASECCTFLTVMAAEALASLANTDRALQKFKVDYAHTVQSRLLADLDRPNRKFEEGACRFITCVTYIFHNMVVVMIADLG